MNWTDYFLQKIKTVPSELQDAIYAVDFLAGLREIQKKYLLHIDQGNELEGATFQFMFGDLQTPDAFKNTIIEKLRIPPGLATSILADVEKIILAPMRQKLQEIEDEHIEDEIADEIIFGSTEDASTTPENSARTETLQTGTSIDHSTLSHEDILNEIENPTPSERKEVIIESNIAQPQKPTPIPGVNGQPVSFIDIAEGFNQKETSPGTPKNEQEEITAKISSTLGISRPKESVEKTASVLQAAINPAAAASQKLSETTTSKPKEVNVPADPYRESF